ncbi:MAG TPA: PD-(D/E)XK nuclease family protein [Acidobacteriaceae bacterium]
MPLPPLHTAVFAALDRGALVLTANQRAARTLHGAYAQRMRAEGKPLWQPPTIAAWESWTSEQWQQLVLRGAETRMLLTPRQERLLWSRILTKDAESRTLRSPQSLAQLASDAWSLLARFGGLRGGLGPIRAQFEAASTDTRTFLQWAQHFERLCAKDQFLSAAQLDDALRSHVEAGTLPPPATQIVLVGFDRITPSQTALCESLIAAGVDVTHLEIESQSAHIVVVEASDSDAEMHAAARALRQKLETDPEACLAVILPDLASVRSRLERIFLSELAPELQRAGATGRPPFEFSLGTTLDRIAMTRTALSLLRWTLTPLPLEEVSTLLLSPYLAGAETERYARATWDAQRLRGATLLQPEISLTWLLGKLQLPPLLRAHLTSLQNLAVEKTSPTPRRTVKKPSLATHGTWMDHAAALLAAAGWPHGNSPTDRPLDSTEFQLQQRWQELLDEIATLDFSGDRIDFAAALAAISSAASETLFAPQSHDAPVQIMGALESAGSAFDSVWFLNATDMQWPATASTHPFIPWTVQRDLAMPGTDAARTLDDGIAITQRISSSAPEAVFSFARRGNEGDQRPSTCLQSLQIADRQQHSNAITAAEPLLALEDAPDDTNLPALPDQTIRGGATILKRQAQCPFRAYAERRLASTALEGTEAGLNAADRGNLIHKALADFWNSVETQSALRQMTADERMQRLRSAVELAVPITTQTGWDRRYLELQRDWLMQLLPQWLEEELLRPPFQVIATERALTDQRIGPLRIDVRVDRIDAALPDGREIPHNERLSAPLQIILDYKTGNIPSKPWDGDRPDEPQLPLYAALADEETLHGLAFARIRPGDMCIQGTASAPNLLKQTRLRQDGTPYANSEVDDVGYLVSEWRKVLTRLAEDFARGESAVDPKQYPQTCKDCAQMPLCRIKESPPGAEEDPSEETPDA